MKQEVKDTLTGLSVIILYLLSKYILLFILMILKINPNNLSILGKSICNILYQLSLLGIIVLIYKKIIIKHLKQFKHSHFASYIRYWIIAIILMTLSNMLINMFTHIDTSTNQQMIEANFTKSPISTILSVIVIAPILEELVFRLSFRKIFKTDILFIILSGLFFGIMHLANASSLLELLYIIPYSIPGMIFAYTLTKSKNIFVPIGLHCLHNSLMVILQLLLIFK